jgi:glycosyltransferase involved in cell wall biosynthesis
MPAPPLSVVLSLGNGSYQAQLPQALIERGALRRLLKFQPDLEIFEPNGHGGLQSVKRYNFNSARQTSWALWTRMPGKKHSRLPVVANAWFADRSASRWATSGNIFHAWTGMCLASLKAAGKKGVATLVEHPMLHPRSWQREVLAECDRFGIKLAECPVVLPQRLIDRIEREFAECDAIAVLSKNARRSFESFPYASKVRVIAPGVDEKLFSPRVEPSKDSTFRVCYVGRIEVAKGIVYLLQAWKKLALANAELVLVGDFHPEMKALMRDNAAQNVRLLGRLPSHEVAAIYRQSSLFVFPSVNEGFGMVILEAMASGLAVIAAKGTGADDCVTHGSNGLIVPSRDSGALADSLQWCYDHPQDAQALGQAARATIESAFTRSHYNRRIIELYSSLLPPTR